MDSCAAVCRWRPFCDQHHVSLLWDQVSVLAGFEGCNISLAVQVEGLAIAAVDDSDVRVEGLVCWVLNEDR